MSGRGFDTRLKGKRQWEFMVDRIDASKVHKLGKFKRHPIRMFYICRVQQMCQLHRGEEKYPRTQMMTLADMGSENKRMGKAFVQRLDKGQEDARLWSWRLANAEQSQKAFIQFVRRFHGADSTADVKSWEDWLLKNGYALKPREVI